MIFASREDAGRRLGERLKEVGTRADLVLGLPRGGVIVAAEVAAVLALPLDVLVVRKIGHPWFREFAVGALAEHGVLLLDEQALGKSPVSKSELDEVVSEEMDRLATYQGKFHREDAPGLDGRDVVLVDDGLATGATTEAAVLSARNQHARSILVAAPVASSSAVQRLQKVADNVQVLWVDPHFDAVGRFYEVFSQTTDEEVLQRLAEARAR